MRIALSGPAGSGKSTLAIALAADLGLQVASEDMGEIVRAHQHVLSAQRLRSMMGAANAQDSQLRIDKALSGWMAAHEGWVERRHRLVEKAPRIVTDRWEADIVGNWLVGLLGQNDQGRTPAIKSAMVAAGRRFDLVVLLPPAAHASSDENEAGITRQKNAATQNLMFSLLLGLSAEAGLNPLILPVTSSPGDRLRLVRAAIASVAAT